MGVKKGDILDERKRHPDGCGLVVKIMGGGEGFQKIVCCGHDLTEEDIVSQMGSPVGRKKGELPLAVILDEKKLYPDSCGLRVMIMDGGAGFHQRVPAARRRIPRIAVEAAALRSRCLLRTTRAVYTF